MSSAQRLKTLERHRTKQAPDSAITKGSNIRCCPLGISLRGFGASTLSCAVRPSAQVGWMSFRSKIHFVQHADIFPSTALPAGNIMFNSQAIECYFHRIEGLAERFLYFDAQ
eukprot:844051-Prymnesium_polylepis.1